MVSSVTRVFWKVMGRSGPECVVNSVCGFFVQATATNAATRLIQWFLIWSKIRGGSTCTVLLPSSSPWNTQVQDTFHQIFSFFGVGYQTQYHEEENRSPYFYQERRAGRPGCCCAARDAA